MTPILWLAPSLYQPRGRQRPISWGAFAERVERARAAESKDGLHRWAPVEFRDAYRCLANVHRAHAVVVDVDDGTGLETILVALDGLFVIVHSTFSATAGRPRWRLIAPLDRPVDAEGYDRVFRWLAMRLEALGARPDFSARDASHAWAVPARPPSGFYVARVSDGAFLDVGHAFGAIPEARPLEPLPKGDRSGDTYDRRLERGRRYLEKIPGAISGSHGHATTFRAAVAMVRGFGLEPDDALRLLIEVHNPTCAPAWSERELVHKVRQAFQRARLPFGAIAERRREAR
jgi:hypothetical protein